MSGSSLRERDEITSTSKLRYCLNLKFSARPLRARRLCGECI